MNPLMEALEYAGDAPPASSESRVDAPSGVEAPERFRLGPDRTAMRLDASGDRMAPLALAGEDAAGGGPATYSPVMEAVRAPDEEDSRASPDDDAPALGIPSSAAGDSQAVGLRLPASALAPSGARIAGGESHPTFDPHAVPSYRAVGALDEEDSRASLDDDPAPAMPPFAAAGDSQAAGLRLPASSLASSGARIADGEPHPTFDPHTVPLRRGAVRTAAIVLSCLAVVMAGSGGGYLLWKTEFVRPALVRHLTVIPAAAANDATGSLVEPVAGAASPPGGAAVRDGDAGAGGTMRSAPDSAPDRAGGRPPWPTAAPVAATTAGPSAAGIIDAPESATDQPTPRRRQDPGAGIAITKRVRADHVSVSLERAYEAFHAGDDESAAQAYRAVLGSEPRNRDALLGLAGLASRDGRWDEAAGHYVRVVSFHPADTVARAALIAIDERDPARSESGLKALLRSAPDAAHLHFDLGNVYAAQSRWPEARRSYSSAYRLDREDADYAYNLAVSLDHLSQRLRALDFYREALALSQDRPAGFDAAAVLARIREIDSSRAADPASAPPASTPAGPASAGSVVQ